MNQLGGTPPFSIRVGLSLPFSTAAVAEYLFRSDVLPYWLGEGAVLIPALSSQAWIRLACPQGKARIGYGPPVAGTVTALAWPAAPKTAPAGTRAPQDAEVFDLVVALGAAPPASAAPRVRLTLTPVPGGRCRLRIEHGGLAGADEARASVKGWQQAVNRVGRLMAAAELSHRRERQAVIVVHGIGNQRPGQMLRQFVTNVFDETAGEVHFVKPDYLSSLFEMRMATVPRNEGKRPTTDVYELYWAHLIPETTVAQVYGWMLRLLFSRRERVPQSLSGLVRGLRVALFLALIGFLWLKTQDAPAWIATLGLTSLAGLPAIALIAMKVFRDQFLIGYAGDAARYLEPRPENVLTRQSIQEAGAQLLDALHDKGRYSRIVVYGHSLGSVIAYDILSHAWTRRSRKRGAGPTVGTRALRALEDLLNPRSADAPAVGVETIQSMQHAAWLEYRRNGFGWLVSDFVTAGSPLAHARWLLNLDAKTQFADLVADRSFPTCPPQTETVASPVPGALRRVFTFTHAYADEPRPHAKRSIQVPHHAGLFAVTRWTNVHFRYTGLFDGDPIAGPVGALFGAWVRDVGLDGAKGFAHGRYTDRGLDAAAVQQVRAALNLPFERPLADFAPIGLQPSVLR